MNQDTLILEDRFNGRSYPILETDVELTELMVTTDFEPFIGLLLPTDSSFVLATGQPIWTEKAFLPDFQ